MVYLPMCYLYGKRFVGPITPIIRSLRKELYLVPYHEVDWNKARNQCAKVGKENVEDLSERCRVLMVTVCFAIVVRKICITHIRWFRIFCGLRCTMSMSLFLCIGLQKD